MKIQNKLKNILICVLLIGTLAGCSAQSKLFAYSTDSRLMRDVSLVGQLENGLLIYSWGWSDEARAFDPRYGASEAEQGHAGIGFVAQDIAKIYPTAVQEGRDGYLMIDAKALAAEDGFMRAKLTAVDRSERCTRIVDTRFTICF